jgi:hypothetical protein
VAQPASSAPATANTDKRDNIFEFISGLSPGFDHSERSRADSPKGSSGEPLPLPLQYGEGFTQLKRGVPESSQGRIVQRKTPLMQSCATIPFKFRTVRGDFDSRLQQAFPWRFDEY